MATSARQLLRGFRLLAGFMLLHVLAGCASLTPPPDRPVSQADRHTQDTPLGQLATQLALPPGHSAVQSLPAPLDAFAARVLLARAATRTLDAQYYIWHGDTTGILMLEELRLAARRGVKVRLLLDDNGIAGLDELLRSFAQEPGVDIRLYNPFPWRSFKAAGYLTDFWRLNHRMHNKSLTADSRATIMGGRNIGDAYFGADPELDFTDLDVLAVGEAADQATISFDGYWNSALSLDVRQVLGPPRSDADVLAARLAEVRTQPSHAAYARALAQADLFEQVRSGQLRLTAVRAQVLADPADKAASVASHSADLLITQLLASVGPVQHRLDLVSAYFVPDQASVRMLVGLAQRGVKVRVVTNSLAATDVTLVHAGHARHRRALVEGGVQLYETRPDPAQKPAQRRRLLHPDSTSSLHGKIVSIDGRTVFIGSMNLDPRSGYINTEMGLLVEHPTLAREIARGLDDGLAQAAWRVVSEDGQLRWLEGEGEGKTPVRHTHDPQTSLPLRMGVRLLMLLPIDALL